MPLFQQSVVKKYVNDVDKTELQIAWQVFTSHFHNPAMQENIRNLKEEEYQEGFVRDLFVKVLGYTLNPQPGYNFVLEKKSVTDSTKSDGAILSNNNVIAVIELKDTGTADLDKVSNQAFGYKHKHKNCTYVITSNFEKLRFYINDATDYEEFNLFTLSQERFELLYLCLHKQNLLANVPLQIKQQSIVEEENVTKQLYADYSSFKRKLFQNITEQNPQYDKLLLFKKTQKLLDRFLFIFFAEDRLLLPPNSVRDILQQWEDLKSKYDEYFPLYSRFIKHFGYLNVGHVGKQHEIFAYNGGLFLPDEILDNITIEDTILYDGTKTLSHYDFETDVDVNILGHIFEHSLTEIEELQAELEGTAIEKKTTKRKKDGVFYTPRYITKYIVENTVGALCTQQKERLQIDEETFAPQKRKTKKKDLERKESLYNIIKTYRNWLLQLTICDPACGSGAFLNAALEYLKEEHKILDELTAKIFEVPIVFSDIDNSILEHNLFGVDINEEATEIAKLSLWLHTAKKGRKLSNLSNNIKCGNSLIDDPAVAGDKAFVWKEEFKRVFDKGGFDVVIGNPPYVRADSPGNSLDFRSYLTKANRFKTLSGKWDLFIPFIELSIHLMKPNGISSLIIPDAFCHANYSQTTLEWLMKEKHLFEIDYFPEIEVFKNVGVNSIILTLHKSGDNIYRQRVFKNQSEYEETVFNDYPQSFRLDFKKRISFDKNVSFCDLHEICYISKGIVGNSDEKFYKGEFEVGDLLSNYKDLTHSKAYFEGKDIEKWIMKNNRWIEYGTTRSPNKWSRKGFAEFFEKGSKLVSMRSPGYIPRILLDDNDAYFNESAIGFKKWIDLKNINNKSLSKSYPSKKEREKYESLSGNFDYKYLLCILNSKLIAYQLNSNRRSNIHIYPDDYKDLKIPFVSQQNQQPFIEKADIMLSENKELHQLSQQFTQLLQAKHSTIHINRKLENWYTLTGNEFLKELSKQKIKFPLAQQQEWLQYFEEQKTKANNIQHIISQTDAAIDAMVYALYGLTEEEIKIVEGES